MCLLIVFLTHRVERVTHHVVKTGLCLPHVTRCADDVHVRGPVFAERIRCVKSINTSEVVRQRIKPDQWVAGFFLSQLFGDKTWGASWRFACCSHVRMQCNAFSRANPGDNIALPNAHSASVLRPNQLSNLGQTAGWIDTPRVWTMEALVFHKVAFDLNPCVHHVRQRLEVYMCCRVSCDVLELCGAAALRAAES